MISVNDDAKRELDEYFSEKEKSPIRVYLAPGGCSGPRLALALDTPGDDDEVSEQMGYTFCIDKALFEQTGDVSIGLGNMGFVIDTAQPITFGGGCSGCASAGGCDSSD